MSFDELKAFAAPIATIVAATIAGAVGYIGGRLKVKEIEISYQQRTRDAYLENARRVLEQVYIPLAIGVTTLVNSYRQFRPHVDFENSSNTPMGATNTFKGRCRKFVELVDDLVSRGASAYLTLPLEEELGRLVQFLKESENASSVKVQRTFSAGFKGGGLSYSISAKSRLHPAVDSLGQLASQVALGAPFFRVTFGISEQLVASPLTSREFEKKLEETTLKLSALIKEVTLGSSSHP